MHVAFIDPGLRTFALVYDPVRCRYVFIGAGCYDRIRRLQKHLDDLMFRIDPANRVLGEGIPPVKHKQRRAMRKAAERMRKRIRDLIDSMHQLLVNWLCVHYDLIVYTDISAKDMVKRDGRKIGRSTARGLMTVGFARFRERLQQRAISTGRHVLIVPESYTTQTCIACGTLNKHIGGKKRFDCRSCNFTSERDCVGGTGIGLRTITVYVKLTTSSHSKSSGSNCDKLSADSTKRKRGAGL